MSTSEEENKSTPAPVPELAEAAIPTPAAPAAAPAPQRVQESLLGQTTAPPVLGSTAKQGLGEDEIPDSAPALQTVYQEFEYTSTPVPLIERKDLSSARELAFFHSESSKDADKRIRRHFDPSGIRSPQGQDWNEALVSASTSTTYRNGAFASSVAREDAYWRQYLKSDNGNFAFLTPKHGESGTPYTGDKAMLRIRALVGYGGLLQIPLFHSGFWISLTAPADGALLELRRRLIQEKIDLGRLTFGLVFSNEQAYLNSWMYDFCIEHLYDTTARVDSPTELRELIKVQDLNVLFWGLACLAWPRGFDYVRPLTSAEGVENYETISAKINMAKLLWVDNASFSKDQAAFMSRRQRGSVTVDEIKKYQAGFVPSLAAGRVVEVNENLSLVIASPTAHDYITDGEVWISNIVRTVDTTFTTTAPTDEDRAMAIDQQSRAARLRNIGSWVKAVVAGGVEETSRELINGTLEVLSQDDEYSKIVRTAVDKFIDDSTRVLIAIPTTNGKESGIPRFSNLIPVDVINTFFTLLAQRVGIISRR